MNNNTFTIQSVHGIKETFTVLPNGTVDTTKPQADTAVETTSVSSEDRKPAR